MTSEERELRAAQEALGTGWVWEDRQGYWHLSLTAGEALRLAEKVKK